MFECDCGKHGVHDQRTCSLSVANETAQDVPVPFARLENSGDRLSEPEGNRRFGFGRGQRTFEHSAICRDPEKGPERKPSEADEIRPREHGFELGAALLVLLRSRVIGIKQQVRVDQDHR